MGTTTNYSFEYPTVGGSENLWGTTLNNTIIAIDTQIKAIADTVPTSVTSMTSSLGTSLQQLRVNSGATTLEFFTPSILDMSDTPSSMGSENQYLKVNASGSLEFASLGSGVSLTDFSVTTNPASGGGSLNYNDAGVFTFTPPSIPSTSGFLTSSTLMSTYQSSAWNGGTSQVGVGGYAVLAPTGAGVSGTYGPGAQLAGTLLKYSGIINNDSSGHQAQAVLGTTLTYGTWRCMGNREPSPNNSSGYDVHVACLWMRTA